MILSEQYVMSVMFYDSSPTPTIIWYRRDENKEIDTFSVASQQREIFLNYQQVTKLFWKYKYM